MIIKDDRKFGEAGQAGECRLNPNYGMMRERDTA
jgi:hypothetical protein